MSLDRSNFTDDIPTSQPSELEEYPFNEEFSLPSSLNSSPLIQYQTPTFWGLLRSAAINLVLPFINGLMLGFGELFAHEIAFKLGWGGTKVLPFGRNRKSMSRFEGHKSSSGKRKSEDSDNTMCLI